MHLRVSYVTTSSMSLVSFSFSREEKSFLCSTGEQHPLASLVRSKQVKKKSKEVASKRQET